MKDLAESIDQLRLSAERVKARGRGNPSVERNVERILVSIKILENNVCEILKAER